MQNYIVVKEKFPGYVNTSTYLNNKNVECVWLSGNPETETTVEEYLQQNPNYKLVTDAELEVLFLKHEKSFITNPSKITEECYNEKLEVLPPCRWSKYGSFSGFYVSERITGNIVSWYFKESSGNDCFTFDDEADITISQIIEKLAKR